MLTIALGLLKKAGKELHLIPQAKERLIVVLISKAHLQLDVPLQAGKGYIHEIRRYSSSRTIEINFPVKNSQLQQTRSPFGDL